MKFDRTLFLGKFSLEAQDHLHKLNDGVLRLERGERDAELLIDIQRAAHTLKGSARMMGLKDINLVAHKLEDLLLEVKEGRLEAGQAVCDLIFAALDVMDACRLAAVEGREGEIDVEEMAGHLERAALGQVVTVPRPGGQAGPAPPPPDPQATPAPARPESEATLAAPQAETQAAPAPPAPVRVEVPQSPGAQQPPRPAAVENRIRVSAAKLDAAIRLSGEVVAAQRRLDLHHGDLHRAWQLAGEHLLRLQAGLDGAQPEAAALARSGRAMHDLLDELVKQSREDLAHLDRVVQELQQEALALRLLPVASVLEAFPRAMRDLARERGKDVELSIEGGETELDRQLLERIGDPLLHLLRNCVDHGIEPPEERAALGKPPRGRIWLRAYALGGSVVVEVQDDGRGIDHDAIRRRAVQQGLADENTLRAMSDRELQNMIFLSGFSTSRALSDISGRGVGLDVVRRNIIDELKGDITVVTRRGEGTRFCLVLPLTLTTQRILFVRAAGQLLGLPVTYVAETARMQPTDLIQVVDREAIRLRDQIVPLAVLAETLHLPGAGRAQGRRQDRWLYLVVVQVADERLALVVDDVVDEEDVLIKPLPQHLKRVNVLSGATLSPDGQIILILHLPGLLRAVRSAGLQRAARPEAEAEQVPRILVVDDSLNTREIEKSILEASGYQVALAQDGLDALRLLEEVAPDGSRAHFDLLVVDVEMPRLDGLSLTTQLRRDERFARLPIIIVSSRDKEEDRRRGLEVGADAYIVKGTFDQQDLTGTVASLLGRAAPQAERSR